MTKKELLKLLENVGDDEEIMTLKTSYDGDNDITDIVSLDSVYLVQTSWISYWSGEKEESVNPGMIVLCPERMEWFFNGNFRSDEYLKIS